ncbi:hypothetical protein PAGA_a2203 [Pseudoalteromonas agarivorans DSM 14585]|uniref:Uncharacterized protein n=1 Tax=Pseudoalteromonas agarivorans DSM 14585 TaxID=1312369 RepID=A0ACA8DX52_9GAMM|nr:hypothetical protein PAGA_a2203 [Pseudoalteromonas agarivorans DSM 14585]
MGNFPLSLNRFYVSKLAAYVCRLFTEQHPSRMLFENLVIVSIKLITI